ncbi:LysM peptidoglycan-binding domain-containing protein [Micromonospora globbae]|uniref:LysM peptidoglycan-binding domain-containing protein n=1 Tax=Micromonospora globbae TaxID=1894969 RepID=UPI003867D13C|nr:LysM peptidoglycan-binding domain-containing protein [Micromonospora globbae]
MVRSAVRRTGRVLTGLGALVVLCAVVVGAPVALLAFAGNPLPDHVPSLAEVGATLTSRDDGQLFLRALAVAGWFGWATFTLSVLVELGAQALRRPAPRLPGMSRQQRAAAALVGSVALIVAAAPAAASAAAVTGTQAYAGPTVVAGTQAYAGPTVVARAASSGPATVASPITRDAPAGGAPVYRVAKGDYLGAVAERYLDEFADYRELARLNRLADPDRIRPGQLIRLPERATDQGVRPHATGRLVARPVPERVAPAHGDREAAPSPGAGERAGVGDGGRQAEVVSGQPGGHRTGTGSSEAGSPAMTVGAARATEPDRLNRPLAISAVLAVASIVGAQVGAVLGLRRRPATSGARTGRGTVGARAARGAAGASTARGADRTDAVAGRRAGRALPSGQAGAHARATGELPAGRHRKDRP